MDIKLTDNLLKRKNAEFIFAVILFSITALFYTLQNKFLPSIDGPAHIHNSTLLKEYFLGNLTVQQNFELGGFYLPNSFSNYFLAILMLICGNIGAIKVFYFIHLVFFLFGGHYFLKSFNIKKSILLSLSFVLFYNSFLLNIGFYNFSFSIIFLLFGIGFFHRHIDKIKKYTLKNSFIFFLLLLLLYYSNGLSFIIYVGYVFSIKTGQYFSFLIMKRIDERQILIKQLAILFVLCLPFVLMLITFQSRMHLSNDYLKNDFDTYKKNLIDFSSFIVYMREKEETFSCYLFASILVLFLSTCILRTIKLKIKIFSTDTLILFALAFLILYFIIPDNYSIGMMSSRLQYFFYLFLFLWLFIQPVTWIKHFVALFLFFGSVYKYERDCKEIINLLNHNAEQIIKASDYIKEDKSVLCLNYSENWLESHFSSYLGIKKPLILLENYEASVGWFPLKWNAKMPAYMFAKKEKYDGVYWNSSPNAKQMAIDYVFVYGNLEIFLENKELITDLNTSYNDLYSPSNSFFRIYARK